MHLATVNRKGGVGKTTTAVYLAALLGQQGRTLLVDADPDQSALRWITAADGIAGVVPIALPTTALHRQLPDLVGDAYAHVVVDTPPGTGNDAIVRSALLAVDTVIVPTGPTIADVDRLRPTVDFIAATADIHPLAYAVLLTRVRRGTTSAREARPILAADHPVLDAEIPLREAIATSWGEHRPACTDDYSAVLAELLHTEVPT